MQMEMAYLLGLYYGNGRFQSDSMTTTVMIEIPYKTLWVDTIDIAIYVGASVNDLKSYLQPLVGYSLKDTSLKNKTILSFVKNNSDVFMKDFMKYIGGVSNCESIRVTSYIKDMNTDEKKHFLKGFADCTGYIRNSNKYIGHENRVYLEIPQNWYLVADIANLLKDVDVAIQTIDWGHPNMRDGNLAKYNEGNVNFWKKEHQIKIFAHEFQKIGFSIKHKNMYLSKAVDEDKLNKGSSYTRWITVNHKFYWEKKVRYKSRLRHPCEDDLSIPVSIRGQHFSSWTEIAEKLGYKA